MTNAHVTEDQNAPVISVNRKDITELLRKVPRPTALPPDEEGWSLMIGGICHKAANEIEQLRAQLKEARRCKHTNRNGTGSVSSDGKIVTSELYCADCGEKLT